MGLRFHKMHGAGNDFMLVDLRDEARQDAPPPIDGGLARRWGDRHTGVGFDQLLVLRDGERDGLDADVAIWNADGSAAEQCGNGMRAIGLYLARAQRGDRGGGDDAGPNRFVVSTPAGEIALRCDGDGISVAMGSPRWNAADIPLEGLEPDDEGTCRLRVGDSEIRFGALSLGNPHAVVEVDSVESAPLDTLGRALRVHPAFPAGCNVGFAEVVDRERIRLRVLERGADETRACGSGACAAVAWLARRGRVAGRVRVEQGGGTLWVETDRGGGPVTLTGPAVHVFEGILA